MKAGNCYILGGQRLRIATMTDFDPTYMPYDGDMSQPYLFSEWVEMNQETNKGSFELLWIGPNAVGAFKIEGSNAGPPQDLRVNFITPYFGNPDGTPYTGDLHAVNLTVENLGTTLVDIRNITVSRIRVKYTKTSGSGTLNVRYRAMGD